MGLDPHTEHPAFLAQPANHPFLAEANSALVAFGEFWSRELAEVGGTVAVTFCDFLGEHNYRGVYHHAVRLNWDLPDCPSARFRLTAQVEVDPPHIYFYAETPNSYKRPGLPVQPSDYSEALAGAVVSAMIGMAAEWLSDRRGDTSLRVRFCIPPSGDASQPGYVEQDQDEHWLPPPDFR